ncbi:hypothetical protein GCM10009530_73810 [Microbispora corallina]|uniref:Uncharacterized protein n=1 Tax=Microbispora corallina TaxID=83302 RepID=A0ABQ4GAX7_9ACTN|nr:hypothetical protein Mco01_72180 [Microbispora corallina]
MAAARQRVGLPALVGVGRADRVAPRGWADSVGRQGLAGPVDPQDRADLQGRLGLRDPVGRMGRAGRTSRPAGRITPRGGGLRRPLRRPPRRGSWSA